MRAGQSSTMAMWVPEGFFLTLLPYSVLGALSNCEQGLCYSTQSFQEKTFGARVHTQYLYYANAGAYKTIRCL